MEVRPLPAERALVVAELVLALAELGRVQERAGLRRALAGIAWWSISWNITYSTKYRGTQRRSSAG